MNMNAKETQKNIEMLLYSDYYQIPLKSIHLLTTDTASMLEFFAS